MRSVSGALAMCGAAVAQTAGTDSFRALAYMIALAAYISSLKP